MMVNTSARSSLDRGILDLYKDFLDPIDEVCDRELLSEMISFSNGWEAAIDKVLLRIQNMPLSPLQKKLLWKEVKSLK